MLYVLKPRFLRTLKLIDLTEKKKRIWIKKKCDSFADYINKAAVMCGKYIS